MDSCGSGDFSSLYVFKKLTGHLPKLLRSSQTLPFSEALEPQPVTWSFQPLSSLQTTGQWSLDDDTWACESMRCWEAQGARPSD